MFFLESVGWWSGGRPVGDRWADGGEQQARGTSERAEPFSGLDDVSGYITFQYQLKAPTPICKVLGSCGEEFGNAKTNWDAIHASACPSTNIVGGLCFFGNLKYSNNDCPKNTKIPRPPQLVRKYRQFQTYFRLDRIYLCFNIFYDFHISKIYQDSTTDKSLKTLEETNCFRAHQILKTTNKTKHKFNLVDVW